MGFQSGRWFKILRLQLDPQSFSWSSPFKQCHSLIGADMKTMEALKKHMAKGKGAHPDSDVKKMRKGGPTSEMMRREGRNMARVTNQRGK
jgi:hypothetical protein